MADLARLLDPEAIFDPLSADCRQQTLLALSSALGARTGLDERSIFEAVMERERLGSTGVGDGVAIPHVRLPGLLKSVGAFARLETPCDFEAVDDRPCDLVFMLLAPETEGGDHLRALALVARTLRDPDLRMALRKGKPGARELLLGLKHGAAA
ncbi:MAG: PTS sugar transporter subunit IIA [Pseudomonadota bacterium]